MRSIDAVLIARDEERCIARAVESLRDAVDRVIVLDTGSTDRTRELAAAAGADVHEAPWPDDFAAARNTALEISDADLRFVVDADEWLVEGGDWLGGPAREGSASVGLARVRSTSEADGIVVESTTVSERLLPVRVRYAGAVHEMPSHDMPVRDTPIVLAHDGYEPEQATRKRGRNEALLRRELLARPDDPYLTYQLGKDLQAQERYPESAEQYLLSLTLASVDAPWRHSLAVRSLSVLGAAGEFEIALDLAEREGDRWAQSPDWFFALGNVFLDLAVARPESAPDVLPLVEGAWLRCLDIGERPDLDGAVRGRGSWTAAHNLAGFYESLGDAETATRYRKLARH